MTIQVEETYLDETGFGENVITALSNTSIDELGGCCKSGIWAVSTTVWEVSERFLRFARMLPTGGPCDTVRPSRVIE